MICSRCSPTSAARPGPQRWFYFWLLLCAAQIHAAAFPRTTVDRALRQSDSWYKTADAQRIADNIASWQNPNGGWWKKYDANIPRPRELPPPDLNDGPPGDAEDVWRQTSTFDNGATYSELRILARAYQATRKQSYRDAVDRGLKFIFDSQYPTGGWPQRFPLEDNYGRHITFNDNAMVGVMELLRDIAAGKLPIVPEDQRKRCQEAFDHGIDCILNSQIKVEGKLTAWCQQHDPQTLAPAQGRTYELPSLNACESAGIVSLLMEIDKPDSRIRDSIESACNWYERVKIIGKRVQTVTGRQYENGRDRALIDDPGAPPLWARFYDIDTMKPFVADRDGIKRQSLADISYERRNAYAWYGNWGARVLDARDPWRKRASPTPCTVSPDGTGNFSTIQAAVGAARDHSDQRHVISIKAGTYRERIRVPREKSPINFRAERPDPHRTILTFDLHANLVPPGTTQPIGTSGTPSVCIEADDFVADNITFENSAGDKGQAVALKITGDRCIFRNCRIIGWQDTLYVDSGRSYFLNCYIEGRVDFIFGGATAVFDRCTIRSKNGGYITAARTPPDQPFGFVFLDCILTGEGAPAYLGRPWQWDRGRKAHVAFIRTKMGPHIRPEGWNQWDRPNNPNTRPAATARYFEFATTDLSGNPLNLSRRVPWSHQLSADQAAEFTVRKVLGGEDNWDPTEGNDR